VQLGQWDPITVDAEVINDEIAQLAKEKLAEGGISSLHSGKKKASDLSGWKYKDSFINPETGLSVVRYRCPVAGRFKCLALLKTVHTQGRVELYMSEMHGVDSHVPAKDSGIFLKFHQMEVIAHQGESYHFSSSVQHSSHLSREKNRARTRPVSHPNMPGDWLRTRILTSLMCSSVTSVQRNNMSIARLGCRAG
jgi:hypothetical protein